MAKEHKCPTPEGTVCVRGKLYNDESRISRPLCDCGCHLVPGEKRRPDQQQR